MINHLSGLRLKNLDPHKNLWVSTWGHTGYIKHDRNAERLDTKGYGFLVGADLYDNGVTTIGAALGYEQNKMEIGGNRQSRANVNAAHALVYGRTDLGPINVRAGVDYAWLSVDTTRHIMTPSLLSENKASYGGNLLQVFVEGSHSFNVTSQAVITPYVGLAYQYLRMNEFTETGDITVLHGSRRNSDRVLGEVGLRGQWHINEVSTVYGNLGLQHYFDKNVPKLSMNFMGGSDFSMLGTQANANSALVGLGAQFQLKRNMSLSMGYEGEFGSRSQDHSAKILWRMRF